MEGVVPCRQGVVLGHRQLTDRLLGNLGSCSIAFLHQVGLHPQAGSRSRGAHEVENLLVAAERFRGPVLADFAK